MRLRVAFGQAFVFAGETYRSGDEFDVADDVAITLMRNGLVVPADDNLRGVLPNSAEPQPASAAKPAAKPGEYVPHGPCEPGERPAGNRSAMAVCPTVGCPCQTWNGECAECRRAHNRYRTRRPAHRAYKRKDWQTTRAAYLRKHPLCECSDCALIAEPLRPAAAVVDHIDGLGPLGPRGHDWTNLRSMTKRCHDRRTIASKSTFAMTERDRTPGGDPLTPYPCSARGRALPGPPGSKTRSVTVPLPSVRLTHH